MGAFVALQDEEGRDVWISTSHIVKFGPAKRMVKFQRTESDESVTRVQIHGGSNGPEYLYVPMQPEAVWRAIVEAEADHQNNLLSLTRLP
jgi:hypothetical protein